MWPNLSSFKFFLGLSTLLTLTSALPIHNTPDSTPAGLTGVYNGARLDNILRREDDVSPTFGSSESSEPILPRDASTSSTLGSKLGEPILPRSPSPDNGQVGGTEIMAEDVTSDTERSDTERKTEVWVEARSDPRAEVAGGRGAENGKWRTAANQFLPS